MPHTYRLSLVFLALLAVANISSTAQSPIPSGSAESADHAVQDPSEAAETRLEALPRFALGIKMSSLGLGIEAGTALTRRSNVRFGFNGINYSRSFEEEGFHYNGELTMRSIEARYDWFPFDGAFRISPGLLFFLAKPASGSAFVPPGELFTLDDDEYRSDPTNPIRGSGELHWNTVAPTFTVGWGNLLPRGSRRFSFPFEIGIAVTGTPRVDIELRGGACERNGLGCRNSVNDLAFQRDLNAQRRNINDDISGYKVYPIISTGFSYRF